MRRVIIPGTIIFFLLFMGKGMVFANVLRLQWVPQTQFAGFYMAEKKGFYKDAGIDIVIKAGKPGINSLQELISKKSDFATSWLLSGIKSRASRQPIILIGQFMQKPALMLIAKKKSGIQTVKDFSGRSLGIWPGEFQVPPKALIRKHRIRGIKIVQQGFSMAPFINGDIDIASAMRYNEYFQVLEAGISKEKLIIFDFSALGMNLPEDGVFVREAFFKKSPGICKKFIDATIKGWQYAFKNKDETVKYITRIANKTDFKTSEKKQRWMLDVMEDVITDFKVSLKEKDFQTALNMLQSTRMISSGILFSDFYVPVNK